jgi:hypothetical protein
MLENNLKAYHAQLLKAKEYNLTIGQILYSYHSYLTASRKLTE